MTSLLSNRRRTFSIVLVFALVSSVVVLAARADGRVASEASSNDGGAWLVNRPEGGVAHVEHSSGQWTSGFSAGESGSRLSVVQGSSVAAVIDRSSWSLTLVDQANARSQSVSVLPSDVVVRPHDNGFAVFDPGSSRLWWLSAAELSSGADVESLPPVYEAGEVGRLAVTAGGRPVVAHEERLVFVDVSGEPDHEEVELPAGFVADHLSAAGDQVVAIDDDEWVAASPDGARELPVDLGAVSVVQQEGVVWPAFGAVDSEGRPVVLDLSDGAAQDAAGDFGLSVRASTAPIFHDDHLFVVGEDSAGTGLWALGIDGPEQLIASRAGIPADAELRLVNDRVWLDALDGTGWTVTPDLEVIEIDARDAFDVDEGDEFDPDGDEEEQLNPDSDDARITDADELDEDLVNEPPSATDDEAATRLGRAVFVDVLLNDVDPDGDVLLVDDVEVLEGGELAAVTVPSNGSGVQVSPAPGGIGTVRARYRVNDGSVDGQDTAILTVEIKPLTQEGNLSPEPRLDRLTGAAGSVVSGNLLRNDRDPDGDSLLLVNLDAPDSVSVLSVHPGGDVLLELPTEAATSSGEIDVSYTVRDEWGASSDEGTLRLTLRLEDTNTPPDARNDVVHTQVGRRVSIDVLANDVDGDNDVLSVGEDARPVGNEVAGFIDTTSEGIFTFEPQAAGTFVFRYSATDRSASDEATIRVEVSEAGGNMTPIAVRDDVAVALGERRLVRSLANDGDPDGDLIAIVETLENPRLEVVHERGVGFWVEMLPDADVTEVFSYRVSDGTNDSELVQVVVTRSDIAVSDASPVAADDAARVRAGVNSRLFPLRNDFDPEGLELSIVDAVASGDGVSAEVGGNGQWVEVDVEAGSLFPFSVLYTVADPAGNVDSATIEATVVPEGEQNTPPTARRDVAYTIEAQDVLVNVLANDDDAEADAISLVAVVGQPDGGSAALNAEGTAISYSPLAGFRGSDGFTYLIRDRLGAETQGFAQVAVMREPTSNQPPVADEDEFAIEAGSGEGPLDVLANDRDPDGDRLTIQSVDRPSIVEIAPSGRSLRYTPPGELRDAETVRFRYTITDGRGGFDDAEVTLAIEPNIQPVPPVAVADSAGPVREGETVTVNVLANDNDPDGSVDNLTVAVDDPSVDVLGDGSVRLVAPAESFAFNYTITDVDGLSDTAAVTLTVESNVAPVIAPNPIDLGEFNNDDIISVNLADFVTDADGDPLTFSNISGSAGGTPRQDANAADSRLINFEPSTDYRGVAGFSFTVQDDHDNVVTGRVQFTLLGPSNTPPVASNATIDYEAGTAPVRFDLPTLFDDQDPGDTLQISASDPDSSQLTMTRDGSTVFFSTPIDSPAFTTTITVNATDSEGEGAVDTNGNQTAAVITVNVTETTVGSPVARNDGPTRAVAGEAVEIDVLANDDDTLGNGITVINAFSDEGVATHTDRVVTFTPAAGFSGEATVQYTIQDTRGNENGQATALWTVNVIAPPDRPAAPVANETGPRSVSLTWRPPTANGAEIISYELRINGEAAGTLGPNPATDVTDLTPGDTYTFEIQAINEAGPSEWSLPSNAVTPDQVPGPPGKPLANFLPGQPGAIEVQWEPGPNEGSDIIEYRLEVGQCNSEIREQIGDTIFTWTGLPNGTRCAFRAVAINQAGESPVGPWSDPECAVAPPGAPTITGIERGDKQATVTWSTPDNPDCENLSGYEILRFRNGANDGTTLVPSGTLTWNSAGLQNGETYTFQVRAENRAGQGTTSTPSPPVIPCGVPLNPPTPTAARGDTEVLLTWTQEADANGCAISEHRYRIIGGNGGEGQATGIVTGLTNGTSYTFQLAAVNEIGQSEWSAQSGAVIPAGPPFAPTVGDTACGVFGNPPGFTVNSNGDNGSPLTDFGGSAPKFEPIYGDSCAGAAGAFGTLYCFNNQGNACVYTVDSPNQPPSQCFQRAGSVAVEGWLENDIGRSPVGTHAIQLDGCPPVPSLTLNAADGQVVAQASDPSALASVWIEYPQGQYNPSLTETFAVPNGITATVRAWACNRAGCTTSAFQSVTPQAPGTLITVAWLQSTICAGIPTNPEFGGHLTLQAEVRGFAMGAGQAGTIICSWFDKNALQYWPDGSNRAPGGGQIVKQDNELDIRYPGSVVCGFVGRQFDNRADGGYCV